jgi:hypothetical protein
MNQLPKFVTERLARPGERPLVHPDADLLTAFVEQTLTRDEREKVFAHLSQCSTCRDVVALAAPETAAASATPNTVDAARNWLQWPGMRWVAVATACVIVAAIGISLRPTLSERGPSQRATEVVREEERQAAAPLTDTLHAEASNASHVTEAKKESATTPPAKKPEPEARNEIDGSKTGFVTPKRTPAARHAFSKDDAQIATFANEKKQSSKLNETIQVTAESATVPMAGATTGKAGTVVGSPTGASTAHSDRGQVIQKQLSDASGNSQQNKFLIQPQQAPGLAKVQPPVDAFKGNAPAPAPPPSAAANSSAAEPSQPTTTAEVSVDEESKKKDAVGTITLERRDRGRSKAVLPNLGAVGFGGAPYKVGTSPSLKSSVGHAFSWKISPDGKLLRKKGGEDSWHEIDLPSSVTLHSLASNNLDAWVGGAPLSGERSGALFHTTDGGEHWQLVDGPWTGDILALQASGAQHTSVLVRTAGGEWQTQDAGANWIRTR